MMTNYRANCIGKSYKVIKAANGREGIEICRQQRPDVILCDLFMPEVDGLEVLQSMI